LTSTPYKDAAFKYLTHGWKGPLPVGNRPRQKTHPPAGYTGNDGAWPTEDQIAAWIEERPNVNIALRLPEHVIGIDVDDYSDKPGADTMIATTEKHGKLPRTWVSTSREGRSGIRWFRLPEPGVLPGKLVHPDDPSISGVEIIQHTHRYAIVPPSIHPEGRPYRWIKPDGTTVTDGAVPRPADFPVIPQAWIDHIRQDCSCWAPFDWNRYKETPGNDPVEAAYRKWTGRMTETYGRHDAALGGAMALVAFKERGWPGAQHYLDRLEQDFYAALGDSRTEHTAREEWRRLVEGAEKKAHNSPIPQWEPRPQAGKPLTEATGRRIKLATAATIKPRPVWWHWQDRIPIGEITLTPGLGGVGKSTFHAWIIAQTTRGTLPGVNQGNPRPAIICAAEDSWERSIVPRLIAAGANLELVYRAEVVTDEGHETRLTLPADTDELAQIIKETGAAVISLDPLLSTIDGAIDSYKSREVREALEPLRGIADETDSVILGNAHFNKATGADPLIRISGSAAFGEVCRAAIAFARDDTTGTYVLSQVKNNLGRLDLPSLTYWLEPVEIPTDEGPSQVARFVLGEETSRSVKDVLSYQADNDRTDREIARDMILTLLAEEPLGAKELTAKLKEEGLSQRTIERARADLKKEDLIDYLPGGRGRGGFVWQLTEKALRDRSANRSANRSAIGGPIEDEIGPPLPLRGGGPGGPIEKTASNDNRSANGGGGAITLTPQGKTNRSATPTNTTRAREDQADSIGPPPPNTPADLSTRALPDPW